MKSRSDDLWLGPLEAISASMLIAQDSMQERDLLTTYALKVVQHGTSGCRTQFILSMTLSATLLVLTYFVNSPVSIVSLLAFTISNVSLLLALTHLRVLRTFDSVTSSFLMESQKLELPTDEEVSI